MVLHYTLNVLALPPNSLCIMPEQVIEPSVKSCFSSIFLMEDISLKVKWMIIRTKQCITANSKSLPNIYKIPMY